MCFVTIPLLGVCAVSNQVFKYVCIWGLLSKVVIRLCQDHLLVGERGERGWREAQEHCPWPCWGLHPHMYIFLVWLATWQVGSTDSLQYLHKETAHQQRLLPIVQGTTSGSNLLFQDNCTRTWTPGFPEASLGTLADIPCAAKAYWLICLLQGTKRHDRMYIHVNHTCTQLT